MDCRSEYFKNIADLKFSKFNQKLGFSDSLSWVSREISQKDKSFKRQQLHVRKCLVTTKSENFSATNSIWTGSIRLKNDSLHLNQWTECPRIVWWTQKRLVLRVWSHFLPVLWCHRPKRQRIPPSPAAAVHNHTHKHEVNRSWITSRFPAVNFCCAKLHCYYFFLKKEKRKMLTWVCLTRNSRKFPCSKERKSFTWKCLANFFSKDARWDKVKMEFWEDTLALMYCLMLAARHSAEISHGNIRKHCQAWRGGIKPPDFIH